MDEVTDCPHCRHASDTAEFAAQGGSCPVCGHYHEDLDMRRHYARRTAAPMADVGGSTAGDPLAAAQTLLPGGEVMGSGVSTSLPGAAAKMMWNGATMTGQEITPAFNPGPKAAALKVAAAAFVDAQDGITDRAELAYRAARHIEAQTGTWPRRAALAARQRFVAAVVAEAPRVRPRRTAAAPTAIADFDDQLLFGD